MKLNKIPKEKVNGRLISTSYYHLEYVQLSSQWRKDWNTLRKRNAPPNRIPARIEELGDMYAKIHNGEKLIICELLTRKQILNRKLNPDALSVLVSIDANGKTTIQKK